MAPYYLLSRDRMYFDKLFRERHHHTRVNAPIGNRGHVLPPTTSLSEMISSGFLYAVNAAQRGCNHLTSFLRG
jgi:hypothetical protein